MQEESEPNTKDGGVRGPPKRWTGKGPRPARHIPWPELFRHHYSVLTGHLKMMDMVRKHCIEGSGNHQTARACVDRTHEMIRQFRKITGNFIPPKDNLERVPLGASSASMYPGYSPADHIYGEASQEFGAHAAELKRKGMELDIDPKGPEYAVGRGKKPRRLSRDPEKERSPPRSHSAGTDQADQAAPKREVESKEEIEQPSQESQYFVIDSEPTPVADLCDAQKQKHKANDKAKRRVSFMEEHGTPANSSDAEPPKSKKVKVSADGFSGITYVAPALPEEDMFAEVEARLKEKEERRKQKAERKRKRDEDSPPPDELNEDTTVAEGSAEASSTKRPKKKKHKKEAESVMDPAEPSAEPSAHPSAKTSEKTELREEKKKKKRRTESIADSSAPLAEPSAEPSAETQEKTEAKKEKKKKKRADSDGHANAETGEADEKPRKKRKKEATGTDQSHILHI